MAKLNKAKTVGEDSVVFTEVFMRLKYNLNLRILLSDRQNCY